jgi:septal ring factor EnvC (AmiA/AmiB activator)
LTEEQWKVKKKEIKYVRERVRRAKRDNENLADNIAKQRTRYAAIRARGKADQSDDDSYDEVLEEVIEEVEETASEGDHGRDEIDNDNSFDLEFGRDETLQVCWRVQSFIVFFFLC